MATVAEIREELAREKENLAREQRDSEELDNELVEATERQRLRRQVDELKEQTKRVQDSNNAKREFRRGIDADLLGAYKVNGTSARQEKKVQRQPHASPRRTNFTCKNLVHKGQYIWKIAEMSWLKHLLKQHDSRYLWSKDVFHVGPETFDFVYNPHPASTNGDEMPICASLAIRHFDSEFDFGVTFRYKIFIQRSNGEFVQWGPQGDVCVTEQDDDSTELFGPDAQPKPGDSCGGRAGIFGLSHEKLLQSDWVNNDTLVAKFEIQVLGRCGNIEDLQAVEKEVNVPPSMLSAHFLSLFTEGKCSDVTFHVKNETVGAHSQVLAARSEVFEKQLHIGLQESVSRKVTIEDCEPVIFKGFLRFLYTDDFEHIKEIMMSHPAKCSESTGSDDSLDNTAAIGGTTQICVLQDMLSLGHKYQVARLSSWCEQQLCDLIGSEDVCSVLVQAHLCEAAQLQEVCLRYIKDNMETLVSAPEFGRLTAEWPEILLKISLCCSGISSSGAASAVASQQELLRKRKRVNSE